MIGALKPYPEYEDSNLPWLGKVPANWQVSRAKLILKVTVQPEIAGNLLPSRLVGYLC